MKGRTYRIFQGLAMCCQAYVCCWRLSSLWYLNFFVAEWLE